MRSILLFFIIPLGLSLACDCFPRADKELFCAADWVGVLKISNSSVDPDEDSHRIFFNGTVSRIFKGSIGESNHVTIETPKSSAACGIEYLEVGESYLLMGKTANGAMKMNICGQLGTRVQPWTNVSQEIKENLEKRRYEPCGKE
uniref:NTR domain-containing protein n=1 Tax=Steinernema glaseri TaxID=37863 RepID=A0A1I8AV77_9BILA